MSMQDLIIKTVTKFLFVFASMALVISCKKEIEEIVVYDNTIYQMENIAVYGSAAEKNKQKTPLQFISIMYADLFNQRISNTELNDLVQVELSIGDKNLFKELIFKHYVNESGITLPTLNQMQANPSTFTTDIYLRFYQRNPTGYEKYYIENLINTDQSITPELIYTSFVLSEEYNFY
jgi:hypothetical protein